MLGDVGGEYVRAVITGLRFLVLIVVSGWLAGRTQNFMHSDNTIVFVALTLVYWFVLDWLLGQATKKRRGKDAEESSTEQ